MEGRGFLRTGDFVLGDLIEIGEVCMVGLRSFGGGGGGVGVYLLSGAAGEVIATGAMYCDPPSLGSNHNMSRVGGARRRQPHRVVYDFAKVSAADRPAQQVALAGWICTRLAKLRK